MLVQKLSTFDTSFSSFYLNSSHFKTKSIINSVREMININKIYKSTGLDSEATCILEHNKDYLLDGISKKMCNAIIIKPNQIGTFTEVLNVVSLAVKNNYIPILSHRSGETEDVILPHLAVGLDIKLVKMGSMSRGERIAKYNELLRISESLK